MNKDELLSLLFREFTGHIPESVTVLPKSGSDRIYCRMVNNDISVLGVWNPSRKENDAFTSFAEHFYKMGLRVPRVYKYLPEEMVYLAEDLGDLDLHKWVQDRRREKENTEEIEASIGEMYRNVLNELKKFQFGGDKVIDYELAYPRKKFDRKSVMWDLNYFKYMFLKLSGTGFHEPLLEKDFTKLSAEIKKVKTTGFMYRDFQSRNIMIKDGKPWFIDFQGGRKGAPYYDVASVLLDPYVELNGNIHNSLLDYYYKITSEELKADKTTFHKEYLIFGTVRLLQALGTYGFRGLYEKKPNFTESIPPAVRQLNRIFENEVISALFPELARITGSLYKKYELK